MDTELERLQEAIRADKRVSPREAELIKYRDNRTPLTFKMMSGETLDGAIRWYDASALRLVQADRSELTVYHHAIAYYRVRT